MRTRAGLPGDREGGGASAGKDADEAQRFAIVRQAARETESLRYFSALLAGPPLQHDLIAIAAFSGEISRVRHAVRDPLLGEIRLQWWHDVLTAPPEEEISVPPAAAFRAFLQRRALPPDPALDFITAHIEALGTPPFATLASLEDFASHTEGAIFLLGAAAAGMPESAGTRRLSLAAGRAFGILRGLLQQEIPRAVALEAGPAAGEHLAEARKLLHTVPREAFPVYLPLALVEPYLRALKKHETRPGGSPRSTVLSPLAQLWHLWRAYWRQRF